MISRRFTGLAVVFLLAGGSSAGELESKSPEAVRSALRDGGFVLYLRHTHTGQGIDVIRYNVEAAGYADCSAQRDLDREGEQDARAIGDAFRAQRIPVGRVLASPYCRTRKTAELAFGEASTAEEHGLATICQASGKDFGRRTDTLRKLLGEAPAEHTNTVLVSHNCNIRALARDIADACAYDLAVGDVAVFKPRGDASFELVDCIPLATLKAWRGSGGPSDRQTAVE